MIPDYEYISKHFNASTEHEMSFEYDDEELEQLINTMRQDPRLPEKVRTRLMSQKHFVRDTLRICTRSYAYALRYREQVQEPVWMLRSAIYRVVRAHMASMPYTTYKETAVWRRVWALRLVEELYDSASYMERFSKGGKIQPLNYWGTGQSKKRYLPSKQH